MTNILTIKNLTIGYGNNIILKDVNLKIVDGDFICIVGANGSGKSTLIKGILGLLKPKEGKIIFQNSLKQTTIGYLPQNTHTDPDFPALVKEIVLSGTLNQLKSPFYSQKERTKAAASLERLNITNLQNTPFSSLSGGQKQKVLLARALSATSKLLILDEPSNNLDHQSKKDFYQTLKQLNKDDLTIIMITHDLDAEDLIGNKVIALDSGHAQLSTTKTYLKGYQK
ncbi:ABC transporter ATP-binding protein [Candidatus Saccharibacteria bacterium]|nr:ABC transporter ATP-binding protein [Candidatus Saccharibacteria bacterium]